MTPKGRTRDSNTFRANTRKQQQSLRGNYYIICCEAVWSAILATAWLLVEILIVVMNALQELKIYTRLLPVWYQFIPNTTLTTDQNDQWPILQCMYRRIPGRPTFQQLKYFVFVMFVCNYPWFPRVTAATWPCTYLSRVLLENVFYQMCYKLDRAVFYVPANTV